MTRFAHGAAAACLALLFPACTVGPDYVPPELDLPDAWHRDLTTGLEAGDADLRSWWTLLGDPVLSDLIDRAARGNLDLRVAYSRVVEAQALRGIAAGNRWPDLEAFGSATVNRASERTTPQLGGDEFRAYQLGADAVWEIDVWGRVTRLIENADASLQATVEGYRDVLVLLLAQVAVDYVELRALQERLRIAESNIDLQEQTLGLTRDRFDAGLVSELDIHQAELNLSRTRSIVPELRSAIEQTLHRLAVLVGENPGAMSQELNGVASPPPAEPDRVVVSGPVDAVRRRPDVRQAERSLAAQTARIGIAEAELYPMFTLFGSFSWDGLGGNVSDWLDKGATSWTLGPSFRWNLFDGGRVQGNIDAERARTDQALASYRQTVLLALEEVENALVAYSEEVARRDYLQQSVAAAQRSVELVDTLYRTGSVDFQNVLDTQRSLAQQQDLLAESQGRIIQNLVRLYKALGGGWDPGGRVAESAGAEDIDAGDGETR